MKTGLRGAFEAWERELEEFYGAHTRTVLSASMENGLVPVFTVRYDCPERCGKRVCGKQVKEMGGAP